MSQSEAPVASDAIKSHVKNPVTRVLKTRTGIRAIHVISPTTAQAAYETRARPQNEAKEMDECIQTTPLLIKAVTHSDIPTIPTAKKFMRM